MESIFKSQHQGHRAPSGPLEVRCGRMAVEGKVIKPDPTKGKITVVKEADSLTHFKWINLQTNHADLEIIVFPEDARFMKAVQAKGRVYLLEVSGRREFFWMQDPDKDKDLDVVKKINVAMGTMNFSGIPSSSPAVPHTAEESKAPVPSPAAQSGLTPEQIQEMIKAFAQRLEPGPGLDDILTPEVLDRVAHESHWNEPLPAGHGRGVSIQAEFGSFMAQVADVSVSGSEVRVERITCVLDCGQVVNPDTVHAQMEGGIVFGLSAILKGEITIKDGRVEQSNFNDYPVLRFSESPRIDTYLMTSDEPPGGVGEAGTACVGAALCNAIYVASGKRIRTLPVVRGLAS